jgi:SAM-dependent methyltransferase
MTGPAGDLAEYYRRRAAEYDAVYDKPERQSDQAALRRLLPPLVAGRRVLEIAAGTGYWTQVIAAAADSVTATDLNAETLAIAAARDYGSARVSFLTADAYRPALVPGDFDLIFCGFWWSHIPRADVGRFLAGVSERAETGAGLVILDNRFVPGSNHAITRTSPDGDTYQLCRLASGREYEVLKNFPDRRQLAADLAPWASGLRYTQLEYFWLASARLDGAVSGGGQPPPGAGGASPRKQ